MNSRARRALLVLVITTVVVLGAVWVLDKVWNGTKKALVSEGCSIGAFDVDTGQAAVASTMVGVVTRTGLPERAAVLVLAAGLQESKLRNLASGAGDRDSVGVLQQRPSQGWGTVAQLSDVHFATKAFLDALVKVADWQTRPLAQAIQEVQVSADASAYAVHEDEAQALADALTGREPAGITCTFGTPSEVAPVATVAAELTADLPVNPPAANGFTVSVPGARWQTVAWFVANADRLGIDAVGYSGKEWTRSDGWQDGSAGASAVVATLHH